MTERIRQNVIIPQVNEPLGLVDGKPVFPTTAWHQYFDGLWKRSGAFNDGLLEEIIRSFVETSENRAAIEAVTGLVRSLEAILQANADDARQAVESAVAAANAARDTLRAETESTIAAALELIETQARVARETARAEAQAELAVALEDAFARLRRVEDNLRAEVQATLASLGELARTDVVNRGNIAAGAISDAKLDAGLIITDSAAQPMLNRSTGKLFLDGYEVNRLFTSSPGTAIAIVNTDTAGKVIARADLLDVRVVNSWALIGSVVDFGTPGTGTMGGGDTASFKFRVAVANPQASPPAIGSSVTGFTSGGAVLEWDVSFDNTGVITINSAVITGAPVITNDEFNAEIGDLILRYGVTGDCYAYFSARWISTTAGDPAGISLQFSTDTRIAVTNLINRNA